MMNLQKFLAASVAATMLFTLTAFAEENSDTSSSSSISSSSSSSPSGRYNRTAGKKSRLQDQKTRAMEKGKLDLACVLAAVTARETSLVTALTARKDALIAAWGNTDTTARKNAIKDAWSTYKTARRAAWKTFKDAARSTCRFTDLGDDTGQGDGE